MNIKEPRIFKENLLVLFYGYNLQGYNSEGYPVLKLNDGSTEALDHNTVGTNIVAEVLSNEFLDKDRLDKSKYVQKIGTTVPTSYFGFTNIFNIYDFSIRVIITGEFGHIFHRGDDPGLSLFSYNTPNVSATVKNAWTKENPSTPFRYSPVPTKKIFDDNIYSQYNDIISASSFMYSSASNIRIKEIYLSYKIPIKKILENDYIKGISIYAQIRNFRAFWVANDFGMDPLYRRGPNPKNYIFGLKLHI